MPRQCQLIWIVAMLFAGLLVVAIDGLLAPIAAVAASDRFGWLVASLYAVGLAILIAKGYWRRLIVAFRLAEKPVVIAMLPVIILPFLIATTLLHAWPSLAERVAPFLIFSQVAFLAAIVLAVVFVFLGEDGVQEPPLDRRSEYLNVRSRNHTIRRRGTTWR